MRRAKQEWPKHTHHNRHISKCFPYYPMCNMKLDSKPIDIKDIMSYHSLKEEVRGTTTMLMTILTVALASILFLSCPADTAASPRIYPYAPQNAVAAEPPTPYNPDQICPVSIDGYGPCPTCGHPSTLLPDLPPAWEPVQGPFGRVYRVP